MNIHQRGAMDIECSISTWRLCVSQRSELEGQDYLNPDDCIMIPRCCTRRCRIGRFLCWILVNYLQFPEVKKVRFLTSDLFSNVHSQLQIITLLLSQNPTQFSELYFYFPLIEHIFKFHLNFLCDGVCWALVMLGFSGWPVTAVQFHSIVAWEYTLQIATCCFYILITKSPANVTKGRSLCFSS